MEERCSIEVLRRNEAIETSKKEVDTLGGEKKALALEVSNLREARKSAEEVVGKLQKAEEDLARTKEEMALLKEQLEKVDDDCSRLCTEVKSKRSSGAALQTQVSLLQPRLDRARDAGLSVAEAYSDALGRYRGVTPPCHPSLQHDVFLHFPPA